MDSKGNQLVKKRLLKFWVVLGLYGLPTGSATVLACSLPHCTVHNYQPLKQRTRMREKREANQQRHLAR